MPDYNCNINHTELIFNPIFGKKCKMYVRDDCKTTDFGVVDFRAFINRHKEDMSSYDNKRRFTYQDVDIITHAVMTYHTTLFLVPKEKIGFDWYISVHNHYELLAKFCNHGKQRFYDQIMYVRPKEKSLDGISEFSLQLPAGSIRW